MDDQQHQERLAARTSGTAHLPTEPAKGNGGRRALSAGCGAIFAQDAFALMSLPRSHGAHHAGR